MPDKAIENAMKHRDGLAVKINAAQQQIDEWKRELKRVDAFIDDWHSFASEDGSSTTSILEIGKSPSTAPKRRTTGNSSKEEVAEAARELIAERGEPIARDELYDLLTKRGLTIDGKDPQMVLSTMLWRMRDRVVRLKEGGYWLQDEQYSPAEYYPEIDELVGAADDSDPSNDGDEPPDDR